MSALRRRCRPRDQGKTWAPPQTVWHDPGNTCGNPCPVVDESTGAILLLLTHNPATATEAEITARRTSATRTVWISRSEDDGQSWSNPLEITSSVKEPGWGWYATGLGFGIQLKNGPHQGRLIVPCDHTYPEGSAAEGASHVIYSDDHGRHWACGGSLAPGLNECQVVEVTDEPGALLLNMRRSRRETLRAQARSADGGLTWTPPQNQPQLIEPRCQASILRYSWQSAEDASRILFSNPAGLRRTNLTVRIGYDEGRTWPVGRVLHAKAAAYSCLAVLPDLTLACLYERGATNAYEKITLARFPLSWLEESK